MIIIIYGSARLGRKCLVGDRACISLIPLPSTHNFISKISKSRREERGCVEFLFVCCTMCANIVIMINILISFAFYLICILEVEFQFSKILIPGLGMLNEFNFFRQFCSAFWSFSASESCFEFQETHITNTATVNRIRMWSR